MSDPGRAAGVDCRLEIADLHAHLFRVTLTLDRPRAGQVFSLPVWIPGSYLVRDFSRHLASLQAEQHGRDVAVEPLDKTRWRVGCEASAALTLRYLVYAFDGSPRGAFLDAQRGFFNGSSLFLQAEGHEHSPHRLVLGELPAGWEVATSMPGSMQTGFDADDYQELIDHPIELGRFWRGRFELRGVPHELVVTGAGPMFDGERLRADARRVCEVQAAVWGELPMPFERYVFLLRAVEDAQGDGLEHRASTALRAARRDLPRRGSAEAGEGYLSLLSLIAHEYFHAWSVKRLRPRELEPLDLSKEQPTPLLWFFEGITSYCDERALLRSGLVDAAGYLRLLAKAASGLLGQPGRRLQSVAQASLDAWIKLYKSDENTPNATVNYYTKGALLAALLDLSLLQQGGSLDEVLRALWQRSGGGPIGEDEVFEVVGQLGGAALRSALQDWVHGTDELPMAATLAAAGVRWTVDAGGTAARLGLRLSEGPVTGVQVRQVLRGSAAEAAGIAAGDEILAADGWRLRRFDDLRQGLVDDRPGASFDLLLVRDQRLLTCRPTWPAESAAPTVTLVFDSRAEAAALALRRRWLGP